MDVTEVGPEAQRAVEHLLAAARRHLDMEAAFLAELTDTEQLYRVTSGGTASFTIVEGGSLPRLQSYCQYVFQRNGPWVVPDTSSDEVAGYLAITDAGRFGAYIGVPVRLPGGDLFGTLCCIHHEARPDLGDRDVAVLEALADVLGFHVAQLREAEEDQRTLRAVGTELAGWVRQHELRLGALSEMVRVAETPTVVLDAETLTVDYCNEAAAALLGAPQEDVEGEPFWAHTDRWSEESLRQELAPILAPEGPTRTSFAVEGVTPGDRVLDVVVQRISVAGGGPVLLATAHDITDRRRTEEHLAFALEIEKQAAQELRRLDSLRNAFLTAVSHELRTPLTVVRLSAETLRSGRADADLADQLLDRMMANADRLDRLLGDLLDLNQFTHGQLRLAREQVELDELVRDAVAQVDLGAHDVDLDLEPVSAVVARTKVERIVVNLVVNASVHTRSGTITVRLRREDDGAVLSVEDEGAGVAEPDREVIFEPFRQGDTAPAHRPGTGIGLSLVAAFAELHGGRAWIDDAPGGGAAFRVLLPIGGT